MADVMVTPKRQKKMLIFENRHSSRKKSLFGVSGVSPLSSPEIYSPPMTSPNSSDAGITPVKTPIKNLQDNLSQLVLIQQTTESGRKGRKSPLQIRTPKVHYKGSASKILGIKQLSPDHGIITPISFYGATRTFSEQSNKSFYQKIRDSVRVRLPMELLVVEKKKRTRSSESASKRPFKIPRKENFTPRLQSGNLHERERKLMTKTKKSIKKEAKAVKKESIKTKMERKEKPTYNWQFFNSKTPPPSKAKKLFGEDAKSPKLLTPPPTVRKRKLISAQNLDHIEEDEHKCHNSPKKSFSANNIVGLAEQIMNDFSEDEEDDIPIEEVDGILEVLNKEVIQVLGDDAVAEVMEDLQPVQAHNKSLFSVFTKSSLPENKAVKSLMRSPEKTEMRIKRAKTDKTQLILDCGQSNLREVVCSTCNMLYVKGDDIDENNHAIYHATQETLKFTGWKGARLAGLNGVDKILNIRSGDPRHWWDKAKDVLEIVDKLLGYPHDSVSPHSNTQVFLYIKMKRIVGCIVVKPMSQAYRVLPDLGIGTQLCSEEIYPVKAGISRIWVHPDCRNKGIASLLVDSVRRNFIYGSLLKKDHIAFSSPTEDGRKFIAKYTNREDYLVYTFDDQV